MKFFHYIVVIILAALAVSPTFIFGKPTNTLTLQHQQPIPTSSQTITPSSKPTTTVTPTTTATPTLSVEERLTKAESEIVALQKNPKDNWDKLNAISGLITGGLVAIIGIIATYLYNERQRSTLETQKQNELNILKAQTVNNLMPQLLSPNPKAVAGAILAIKALGNDDLALKIIEIFNNEGTAIAATKIASSGEQLIAERAQSILLDALSTVKDSIVRISVQGKWLGAGFVISTDGYIVALWE